MSYAKAAELLHVARFVAGAGVGGVTLGEIEARFGCDRRRAQRMIAALASLCDGLERVVGRDRRPRWRLPAEAIAPLNPTGPPIAPPVRHRPSPTRDLLVEAARRIMIEQGYAAVSTRSVARRVGLTPASVHYHFPTTEDLLVAAFRETSTENTARTTEALASDRPLHDLWRASVETMAARLAIEFVALANHRKAIAREIAPIAEAARRRQAAALAPVLARAGIGPDICTPAAAAMLLLAVAMLLNMERGVGIGFGHEEAIAVLSALLARIEPEHPFGEGTP